MGNTTASLRATTVVPRTTKPTLRLWADMIRMEGLVKDAEGVSRMRRAATALYDAAMTGNTAALQIIGDRLDGKVATMPDENGQVSLSFVVRLPQMLEPAEWQAMTASRPARIVDVEDPETHAHAQSAGDLELAAVEPLAVELAADLLAADVEPPGDGHQGGDGLLGMVKRAQEPAK